MYLLLKTDQIDKASLSLISSQTLSQVAFLEFDCYKDLSSKLLKEIISFLKNNQSHLKDLKGIGVFSGPGSFTNLRIAHSMSNALAYSLKIPVVNAEGSNWQESVLKDLKLNKDFKIIKPYYGKLPNITKQKK